MVFDAAPPPAVMKMLCVSPPDSGGAVQRAQQAKIMRMQQQQNDNFNDVRNGVTFTRDPETGQTCEVQTLQGGHKWTNGRGTVVDSAMSPSPAFRQRQVIGR
jgi:hypothetical protein